MESNKSNVVRPLGQLLKPLVPIRYPHFERHYELGTALAYSFGNIDCHDWYRALVDRICRDMHDRRYLPIYRMADGEFMFALGGPSGTERAMRVSSPKDVARIILNRISGRYGHHRSGSGEYGFEEYTQAQRRRAYDVFLRSMRTVARKGILALAMHDTPIYKQYIGEMLRWFDINGIRLTQDNYHHIYSVYALMHGPDSDRLLKGRRVLVVTGLTDKKRHGIEKGLNQLGVEQVQFLPISSNHALLDNIDVRALKEPVDVALVGAGIGAVNIITQLEPLSIPCLDVGFALSTLENPDYRWNRPFCVPDEMFELSKIRYLGPEDIAFVRELNRAQGRVSPQLDQLEALHRKRLAENR